MSNPRLNPCFFGPYGENNDLLDTLTVEFLMVSDLLLPGLAAQILTLRYNPNNVSEDAAPVTIDLEMRAGLQLARMLGYRSDPAQPDCAFGHLTSGGTVANYQALGLALKAFPVALQAAAPPDLPLPGNDWAAFNLTPSESIQLLQRWLAALAPAARRSWQRRVQDERIEQLGLVEFFARHPELSPPVVLAPVTTHYSWSKGMKLLGLGREQLLEVPERDMRLDVIALKAMIEQLHRQRRPVLLVLGVHEPVVRREESARHGFGFSVHVDAAWGGYLATLFRTEDGSLRPFDELRRESSPRFPARSRTQRWRRCASTTRSRWIRTSWATCPMAPALSSAATIAP